MGFTGSVQVLGCVESPDRCFEELRVIWGLLVRSKC